MEGSSHSHSRSYSHHHSRSHSRTQFFSGAGGKKPPLFPSSGGNAAYFTTSYDDVFGGPPTYAALAPRAEDYSEIFGSFRASAASRASSIPVLDLPAVADIDAAASYLDYSEVFGGFDAVDFAVPYDELFRPFVAGDGDCSSDEAWTPVGTESLSDESDPFAFSEKSPSFSDGNSHQSFEDKQFNVSYHKVNPGTSTFVPNMTHVAELNAVPGYTCVVDEPTSMEEIGNERFCSTVDVDIILSVDSSSVASQRRKSQTVSHMPHAAAAAAAASLSLHDSDHRSGRARSTSMSSVNLTFASASDVNSWKEPSNFPPPFRPPPVPAERKGNISRLKTDPKGPENGLSATFDSSIPFFEMEVDASSSAAVSAAAIRDAMEKAQEKLKAAKVSMDRKKGSHQNGENAGLKAKVNGVQRGQVTHDESALQGKSLEPSTYRAPDKIKSSGGGRHARSATEILPNNLDIEQLASATEKPAERKNGKKHSSFVDVAPTGGAGEWKEATQYFEFVNNDTAGTASEQPNNGDGRTTLPKQDPDDEHNSDSADEVYVPEENRRRLKVTKSVSRQEYYEKMVKVAQEVHHGMIGGHAETETGLGGVLQAKLKQHKGKQEKNVRQPQQIERENLYEAIRKEGEIRTNTAPEKEEIEQKAKEFFGREHNDTNRNGPHQRVVHDAGRRMKGSCKWEECEGRSQEDIWREENEQRAEEACEGRKEKKQEGASKQRNDDWSSEVKNTGSKEAFDIGFGGEVLPTACERRGNDSIKDFWQSKQHDNRNMEACDNVGDAERLQTSCESHQRKMDERPKEALEDRLQTTSDSQENVDTKGSQQLHECDNCTDDAVDGQGTQKALQDAVEQENGRECRDFPEQGKLKERMDEAENLVDKKALEKNQIPETGEVGLQKPAKEGQVGRTSMQVDEEGTCNVPGNTSNNDSQKTMLKSSVTIDQVDGKEESNSSPETVFSGKDECEKFPNGTKPNEEDIELDNMTCKLHEPQMKDHDSLQVPAQKGSGGIGASPADKENRSGDVKITDVLIDERLTKSTVSQAGASNNENKRTVRVPEALHAKDTDASGGSCTETLNHEDKKVAPSVSDPKLANAFKIEREEKRNVLEDQAEEKVRATAAEGNNGWYEQSRKKEAAHSARQERMESVQKRSETPVAGQSTERKGKATIEEKNREKEIDLEQEQLRKLEAEREREREREKDRMAVETAIREARERAYADVRDRAERAALERATDEARQRAMADARERLEKACAEARERSLADKTSEARLRAERAAVERATAEARQRAIEKAKAERVSLEARDRMQRSVSEKYSYEREPVMRQSSMPSISERSEGADGEPAERCRARLERHRRTVERVAKALAEKNMRDLLAQREQAERNRFAEALDADIRRWSSGKEGNLRALLSTLQYILGPESGWQPVPLTEVITAAAVKKAYRKATLCVHPDKLQQRGASIQQKYICEKVFDLLKEAWNRFNSEEK